MKNQIETIADIGDDSIAEFIRTFKGQTVIAEYKDNAEDDVVKKIFELTLADFPLEALEKFLAYGMQRVFNDMVGGKDKFSTTKDKMEFVEAVIGDYKLGIVRKIRVMGAPINNVQKLARQLARKAIRNQFAIEKRDYTAFSSLTTADQNVAIDKVIAADPQYTAQAQAQIDLMTAGSDGLLDGLFPDETTV